VKSATYRPVLVAGRTIKAPTDELLKGGPGEKVSYQTVDKDTILSAPRAQKDQPDLLIYKATTLEEASALKGPNFNRLLVVMDAGDLLVSDKNKDCFSWDQTVEDFWGVGADRPFHLLIRLGHEGAIYKPPHSKDHDSRQVLIFDTQNPEGHLLKSYLCRRGEGAEGLEARLEGNLQTAYFAGLAASLAKESSRSLGQLCETQVKEAATTALRWSRRYAAATEPARKGAAYPRPPSVTWQSMKLEIDGDPVFISIRLSGNKNTGGSLVFRAMPYSPSNTPRGTS
jgi:hypothetical protein